MKNRMTWRTALAAATLSLALAAGLSAQHDGWTIPDGAADEKSPLKDPADAAKKGRALFASSCAKCHGPQGKGDGPDSKHAADLTNAGLMALNPDGILFYKIWNGHGPDMPAFKSRLTKDDVWALVEHVKGLSAGTK